MIASVTLALVVALGLAGPASAAPAPRTPIEHFVVLMQENHSFDNYFGTFPGANGIPPGTCMPIGRARRPCVRPFHLGGGSTPDPAHDAGPHRMDGFIRAASRDRQSIERSVMGHYDRHDLPFYWNVAEDYVLFDRFFAASPRGSIVNHRLWVSGIFRRLERRGIPWKFYVQDYDPRPGAGSAQAVRVPVRGSLARHVVDLDQYYLDVERGRLPAVAYIAPAGASEHPPGRLDAGATLTRSLVTALARSAAWDSSAFLWTYDEPGGWFDHVRPPPGKGFRVPALLVSAYARRGHVESTPMDTAAIPAFIERNWRLPRRIDAGGIERALDFSQPPREPTIVAAVDTPEPRRQARLWVIYLAYGAALALTGVLIGWARWRASVAAAAALLVLTAAPAAAQTPAPVQTVPPVPGMRFSVDGARFEADAAGRASPPTGGSVKVLTTRLGPRLRARFDRWYAGERIAAISLEHRVGFRFLDPSGERVDPGIVGPITLTGSNGRRHVLRAPRRIWLQGNRVAPESGGTKSTAVVYAVEDARVGGSSVVHRGQQRFLPAETRTAQLRLLLFSARFEVRDALLGFPIGSAVLLEYPDGRVVRHEVGPGGELTLESLPRGDYRVSVDALGMSSSRPIALSGDQEVRLQVISWLDVAIVLLGLLSVALALLYVRRPSARAAALTTVLFMLIAAPAAGASRPDPLFAYYYIWFNTGSWNRAKIDYPVLGRYSSDDRAVMARHIDWAKGAGIDGFIVSWKSTPVLNRRLGRLIEVADAKGFRLLVIYQGLDFHREPLPAARIGADLDLFIDRFSHDRAFRRFGKPVVIWSGTPKFSRGELGRVTEPRRDALHILASERNVEGYRRVAGLVDGNAYYWASVNPLTYPDQAGKLAEMGAAVHARGGVWIPSAAPGFDARAVGGTSVVERRDGATLRAELDAAASSSPDAIGLISWNEFSENTHVEPSRRYGSRYLRVLGEARGVRLPPVQEFDSSEPAATDVSYGLPLLGGLALLVVGGGVLLTLRR